MVFCLHVGGVWWWGEREAWVPRRSQKKSIRRVWKKGGGEQRRCVHTHRARERRRHDVSAAPAPAAAASAAAAASVVNVQKSASLYETKASGGGSGRAKLPRISLYYCAPRESGERARAVRGLVIFLVVGILKAPVCLFVPFYITPRKSRAFWACVRRRFCCIRRGEK